jgi:uncharacterized repeat protein (TIGR04138 family)
MSEQDFTHFGRKDFDEVVEVITKNDSRYDRGAYLFIRKALDFTFKSIQEKKPPRSSNHVSGQELLEGIREFSLDQFGPMTLTLFRSWGIRQGEDFGEIVFNLVDYGVFGTTEKDSRDDFSGILDFYEAFEKPYLPQSKIS